MSKLQLSMPILNFRGAGHWLSQVKALGLTTVYMPVDSGAPESVLREFEQIIFGEGLQVAEVGVWNNLLDRAPVRQQKNTAYAIAQLELAERFKARCCVNISGSKADVWDHGFADYARQEIVDEVVHTIQKVIDAVQPQDSCYSLESMPYLLPDSPESYLELHQMINRASFGVHIDLANWINQPRRYFNQRKFMDRVIELLGAKIVGVHLKDIRLRSGFPFSVAEVPPGQGELDLLYWLRCLTTQAHSAPIPILLEHMTVQDDYLKAYRYVETVMNALEKESMVANE